MKRIFALVLSFAVLFSCLLLPAGAMFDPTPVYQVQAQSAYIVNTDTNIIVYDKDSAKQVPAGGLTKYMTVALLLTNYADHLDDTFQMPFAISDYVYNTNNADMRSNETFTYREAVYAMLTRNANEAAMGLAYTLSGGDLAGWVSQMNTLSQRIGRQHMDRRLRHRQRQCDLRRGYVPDPALPDELRCLCRDLRCSHLYDARQGKAPVALYSGQPERRAEQIQRRQILPQRHAGRHVRCDRL